MPELSVVIPVGRVDEALRQQLDAVAAQRTERDVEVVLACNVPGRTAREALDALVAGYDRPAWRVVGATDRRGPSHARNVGARAAASDRLLFCDADDLVDPGWVEAMAVALERESAVTGRLEGFGLGEAERSARPPSTPGGLPTYFGVPYLMSGNLGVHRAVFESVGGFDEELRTCEDMAFSWSLLVAGHRLGWAPDALVRYRYRAGWRALVVQQVRYGRGMSQLLVRYGIPGEDGFEPAGRRLLRANGMPGARRSVRNSVRRGSIATGRLIGLAALWRPGR